MNSSNAFMVYLPSSTTEQQLEKILCWSNNTCERSDLVLSQNGEIKLIAVRKEAKSLRTFQRLLSTNFANWGFKSKDLKKGWIKLIDPNDFDQEKQCFENNNQTPHNNNDANVKFNAESGKVNSCATEYFPRIKSVNLNVPGTRFKIPVSLLCVY